MFWAPYRNSELKTIEKWFEQPAFIEHRRLKNFVKNKYHSISAFAKGLFFDKALVKNVRLAKVNKNALNKYLQEGKLTLREYLHLSR